MIPCATPQLETQTLMPPSPPPAGAKRLAGTRKCFVGGVTLSPPFPPRRLSLPDFSDVPSTYGSEKHRRKPKLRFKPRSVSFNMDRVPSFLSCTRSLLSGNTSERRLQHSNTATMKWKSSQTHEIIKHCIKVPTLKPRPKSKSKKVKHSIMLPCLQLGDKKMKPLPKHDSMLASTVLKRCDAFLE